MNYRQRLRIIMKYDRLKVSMRILQVFFSGFFITLLVFSPGCKDDTPVGEEIPYVYVNFFVNPGSIEFGNLEIVGNSAYVTGGYRGIILYHKSENEYNAFERTSPVNYPNNIECRVDIDPSGLIAVDSCSNAKWLLLDGSPFQGTAQSLRQYQTFFDGHYLHVFN